MRLAVLTGLYVAVVVSAQVGTNKIVDVPWTDLTAPGGTYLIGIALSLIELAHRTAPTRREGWVNAQIMVACGFGASALLAIYIKLVDSATPAFPGQTFHDIADTWRIVGASLAAFAVSETLDNGFGAWLRGRVHDGVRVLATNAVSVPLDSIIFLVGLPLVLGLRRLVPQDERNIVAAQA